jgi:2'-5' RNA ligase
MTHMAKMLRTFIAVEISDAIRQRALKLQRVLGEGLASVKWVEPENIHMTLQFLGNVPDIEVPKVCRLARESVADTARFTLTVSGAGSFPNAQRPRTLWLGVTEGAELMTRIYEALEQRLTPLGYRHEERRFTPHLTIGRVRDSSPQLADRLAEYSDWNGGSMEVKEITVMSSELTSDGPHYTTLGRAPLRTRHEPS